MNSVRLCIPGKRGFRAIPYRVVGDIYHPPERSSWQTRARGVMQASCARVNRRNSTLLFSFHGPEIPRGGVRETGTGCWWRVLRLPPTLSQVHIPDSRILRAKKALPAYQVYLYLTPYSTIFPTFASRRVYKAPTALQFRHDFLL